MIEPTRILVALPPNERAQLALVHARELAHRFGASVRLIACVYDPDLAGAPAATTPGPGQAMEQARAELAEARLATFQAMAEPLASDGIPVQVGAVWTRPVYAGLLEEIGRYHPDLVIAPTLRHTLVQRLGLTDSDWQVIRHCTTPLLLARKAVPWREVLVAVDPLQAHGKPADLDERLMAAGALHARAAGARLHVLHCHLAAGNVPLLAPGAAPASVLRRGRNPAELHQAALRALAERHDVPAAQVHFEVGDPRDTIPAMAERLGAGLVVMGAVARSRLRRLVTGSTAEAVLDELDCDVLLLHPLAPSG